MSEHKFKVGDIVMINKNLDNLGLTSLKKTDLCKVMAVMRREHSYVVEHNKIWYALYDDCFDLYEPNKPSKKSKVIELARKYKKLIEDFEKLYEDSQRFLFEIQDTKAENEHLKKELEKTTTILKILEDEGLYRTINEIMIEIKNGGKKRWK